MFCFSCLVIAHIINACFFFQAEDGIRDLYVTGVQTCALPISRGPLYPLRLVRFRLLERLGYGERDASADDPCVRHERQSVARRSRRAASSLLADQARLQDDEVFGLDDIHRRATTG